MRYSLFSSIALAGLSIREAAASPVEKRQGIDGSYNHTAS
jgi:hypothetical protein